MFFDITVLSMDDKERYANICIYRPCDASSILLSTSALPKFMPTPPRCCCRCRVSGRGRDYVESCVDGGGEERREHHGTSHGKDVH